MNPRRIASSANIIKPSTLLRFHDALKKRKYRRLFSPGGGCKPGPQGPPAEVINAIVEMKQRNPRFGCPRVVFAGRCWIKPFFWTSTDLAKKLGDYQRYYNDSRAHSSRLGSTPIEATGRKVVDINNYRWKKHCRGLFQLPIAA